eukprot:TRINITY_DN462_c0_g1_i1.p1 TRINITY_DN462_c0_g1~~TRINITY_DN462_c0_g1_i1.p1  ORF type:complete len:299 (+),score=31.28 TRINITY_DN462_c0_g1_i1:253-1149(+)
MDDFTKVVPGHGYIWLTIWFSLNIGLTIMNKSFFAFWDFGYPVTLSSVHMLFTCVFSYVLINRVGIQRKQLNTDQNMKLVLFSLLFTMNIVVGNIGIRFVSVSLVQVIRSLIPGITMLLSFLILAKTYEKKYLYSVVLVCIGVCIASFSEANIHSGGLFMVFLVCLLSSSKTVVTQKFMQGKMKFHPFDLINRLSFFAFFQMFAISIALGETSSIVDEYFGAGKEESDPQTMLCLLAMNGIMAFSLNVSNFITTKKTSALTVTVAGNVKHATTIVFSILTFKNEVGMWNIIGIVCLHF